MNHLPIKHNLPAPEDAGHDDYLSYMAMFLKKFGDWCHGCIHLNEYSPRCSKGHKPRTYRMEYGPHETVTARANCPDVERGKPTYDDEENAIRRRVKASLDCHSQSF